MITPQPLVRVFDLRTGCIYEREKAASIAWARSELNAGRCIICPTDTVFGLLASARDAEAVARIAKIKGRTSATPPPVLIDSVATAERLVTPAVWRSLESIIGLWPGPLSVIVETDDPLGRAVNPLKGTVALRVPALDWLRELCLDLPLAASSANRHGMPTPTEIEAVITSLADTVGGGGGLGATGLTLAVDYGGAGAIGSTVIDLTSEPARMVREGKLSYDTLLSRLPDLQPLSKSTS
jgi:L-threonylcarbamoyladenylate synthase